jgi:hypothetical protein
MVFEPYTARSFLEVVSPPSQAQFLCWTEGFNTRNIKYIPAFESLVPP